MNRSMPGLPVHHQLPEFTQTHVHRVRDAIQPSRPLSSPSPPAPNPSQHQSLFQRVNSSHEVAKVLEFWLYHHAFKEIPRLISFRMDWLVHSSNTNAVGITDIHCKNPSSVITKGSAVKKALTASSASAGIYLRFFSLRSLLSYR